MVHFSQATRIAQLLRDHAAALELYASQWTSAPEDCVQDAFVELSRQAKLPNAPLAWLYRVVRYRALNQYRAAKRRASHEQFAAQLAADRTKPSALDQLAVQEALQNLGQAERELVILRIWSGLTWSEIATLTNTSTSSAHRTYLSALQTMKRHLDPICLKKSN